ncbi:MAG TPA: hypothetical protein VFZ66_05650 [Herpetosiphonaceae bacterium]
MTLEYALFHRYDAKIVVAAERDMIAELEDLAEIYIPMRRVDGPLPGVWTVSCGREATPPDLGFQRLLEESPGEPLRETFVNAAARWIMLDFESREWQVQNTLRMIRNVLRVELYEARALFLHGAMVDVAGAGVAYLGHKCAGKTSSTLAALSQEGVNFVNNDDLTVLPWLGTPRTLGWPRVVGIRFDTVDALEAAHPRMRDLRHDLRHPSNRIENPPRYFFYPKELAAACGRAVSPEADLRFFVFPRFLPRDSRGAYLEPLPKAEALELLRQNLEPVPDKYNLFLHDYYTFPDRAYLNEQLEALVERVPAYVLHQSFSSLVDGAKLIVSLATS